MFISQGGHFSNTFSTIVPQTIIPNRNPIKLNAFRKHIKELQQIFLQSLPKDLQGKDDIANKIIKRFQIDLIYPILDIFNTSIEQGHETSGIKPTIAYPKLRQHTTNLKL